MDARLRQMLRDPRSTPLECYWELARSGAPLPTIYHTLLEAGKIEENPKGFGQFETLRFESGDIPFSIARLETANQIYADYDFGSDEIIKATAWEVSGDFYAMQVFLRERFDTDGTPFVNEEDSSTYSVELLVQFQPDACLPARITPIQD